MDIRYENYFIIKKFNCATCIPIKQVLQNISIHVIKIITCNLLISSTRANSLHESRRLDNFRGEPKLASSLTNKLGGVESALNKLKTLLKQKQKQI